MKIDPLRFVAALDRLRAVRKDKADKDIQLFDIMVLMMLRDGEYHTNQELSGWLRPYITNANMVLDSVTRLSKTKGLLERDVDPYNTKALKHRLTRQGAHVVSGFIRDLEDSYVDKSTGR